jgi:hypothetical protein
VWEVVDRPVTTEQTKKGVCSIKFFVLEEIAGIIGKLHYFLACSCNADSLVFVIGIQSSLGSHMTLFAFVVKLTNSAMIFFLLVL